MTTKPSPALALLAILLACAIALQIRASLSWGHESYQMTEWLINYAGGFVRRGLPGAIIAWLSDATGIRANHLVVFASVGCYLLLAAWLLRRSTRVFPASLVISCIVMGFPAYQDSIVRKDCLGLLLLLGCLKADRSRLPRFLAVATMNLVAAISILSHEAFVFYAMPALLLLQRPDHPSPTLRCVFRRSLMMLPAAAVFLVTAWHHGTPQIARAVHESWLPLWQSIAPNVTAMTPASASIEALGWSSSQGLSLSIYMLTHGIYQPMAWAMVFAMSFVLILLFTGPATPSAPAGQVQEKVRITALLAVQLIFISPLFLLGVDYGRWLFFWVTSSIMLQTLGWKAPGWMESAVSRIFISIRLATVFERLPAKDWYLLLFGVPVCWNLHNFVTASPLMRHLEILRSCF